MPYSRPNTLSLKAEPLKTDTKLKLEGEVYVISSIYHKLNSKKETNEHVYGKITLC